MNRRLSFVPGLFFVLQQSFSQPYIRQVDAIPVQASGSPLSLPFAGGINSPTHQFVDIDGDSDYDLVILDNDLTVDFYRNEGTRFVPNFKLRNGAIPLPSFTRWGLFLDFDGDGRIDICTEDSTYAGIKVYKNIGTVQSPVFTVLHPALIDSGGNAVFAGQGSIPAFADIDADGDLDLFSSNFIGTVNFYENIGSATAPLYAFRNGFWEHITIFGDSCTTSTAGAPLHGAAVYRFADIDSDGDLDFFIGDLFSTSLFYLCNVGTPQVPHMICCSISFPEPQPVRTSGFNQPSFVDIDGDGDLDLFVGVLGGIVQRDGFWFYRNIGTPTLPSFQVQTRNYLTMIDAGLQAHPTFVDIDADGDQDMFIGNINGQITFFRNAGVPASPAFMLIDTVYQNIQGGFSFVPTFVDIDNDGDRDLFIGKLDGRLSFYRNTGTPPSAIFVAASSPVDTINVTQSAAPAFVDIDNDGDYDLFVGKSTGKLSFYRNNGNSSSFQPVLVSTFYQNITAGQSSVPAFTDIDGDGDYDLFVGTSEGRIEFYRNDGTPANAQFVRITNAYGGTAQTQEASPAFVDIDTDGDMDLFMGVMKGGVHFYRNQLVPNSVGEEEIPLTARLFQNYPNPFNPVTTISYAVAHPSFVILNVFDVLGRDLATLVHEMKLSGSYTTTWDASNIPSGVYFYRLTTTTFTATRKLVLLR